MQKMSLESFVKAGGVKLKDVVLKARLTPFPIWHILEQQRRGL